MSEAGFVPEEALQETAERGVRGIETLSAEEKRGETPFFVEVRAELLEERAVRRIADGRVSRDTLIAIDDNNNDAKRAAVELGHGNTDAAEKMLHDDRMRELVQVAVPKESLRNAAHPDGYLNAIGFQGRSSGDTLTHVGRISDSGFITHLETNLASSGEK